MVYFSRLTTSLLLLGSHAVTSFTAVRPQHPLFLSTNRNSLVQQNSNNVIKKHSRGALHMSSTKKEKTDVNVKFEPDDESEGLTFESNGMASQQKSQEEELSSTLNFVDEAPVREITKSSENNLMDGLLWRGVVVVLCALWASNFAAAKLVMAEPGVDSSLYALSRFSVAALALLPGAVNAVRRGMISMETAKGAAICGSWVAFGYLGQTLGLLSTTASRSCVICTLHCVFVAIVAEWTRVQTSNIAVPFNLMRLVPAAVAVTGVAIVELQGAGGAPTIGDALSFAQPIGFGLGYLQLEELMRKQPEAALPVSAIKLIVVALASFVMFELSPLLNSADTWAPTIPNFTPILTSPTALAGILYTGLITTAFALWIESIAFKRVPATDASIILTTEPLFAAAAGALTLGETFGMSDYVGATLIVGACILAVLLDEEDAEEMCDVYDPATDCQPTRNRPFSAE
mmetsp:Transcript_25642/g.36164  ORF Transcript_25642/g.36164 Transcript_25642/m.36164 type:complete len:460 (+) Transcript_25642:233-1612(+)